MHVTFIGVHCSDSDIKAHDNVETIRAWHLARGFDDVGYHKIITQNGEPHDGRPLHVPGAHIKGHNKTSLAICLTGRDVFQPVQFVTLEEVCREWCEAFGLSKLDVLPHNAFDKGKTCPNFDLVALVSSWAW